MIPIHLKVIVSIPFVDSVIFCASDISDSVLNPELSHSPDSSVIATLLLCTSSVTVCHLAIANSKSEKIFEVVITTQPLQQTR